MEQLSYETILGLSATTLAILLFIHTVTLRKANDKLKLELATVTENLTLTQESLKSLKAKYTQTIEFQKKLSEAELTTKLQQPRLSAQHQSDRQQAPERYQYVRTLAKEGMDAEEIAKILSISKQEAEQLVTLSKLSNPL